MATSSPPEMESGGSQPTAKKAKLSAYIAAAALVIGNVAGVLSNIEDIRVVAFKWLDLGGLLTLLSLSRLLIALSMEVFFAILAYWSYRIFVKRGSRPLKVAFWGLYICAVPAIAYLSAKMVAEQAPVDLILHQEQHFADRIWEQQVRRGPGAGGLRFSLKGTTDEPQPWTTAQGLVGVLESRDLSKADVRNARLAFDYLERVRVLNEGWGYFAGNSRGVTEINAWITLAKLLSLRSNHASALWSNQPLGPLIASLKRDLDELLVRQHDDGCFGPIRGTTQLNQTRAYSTVMALWALGEAKRNRLIKGQAWWEHDDAIKRGIQCLLRHRVKNQQGMGGWWPALGIENPSGVYPGLTAQTLFVIYRADEDAELIGTDPRFGEAVVDFVNAALRGVGNTAPFKDREVSQNDRVHDSYRYLAGTDFQVESSTFLWHPWTLALMSELAGDETRPAQVRRDARRVASSLIQRSGELTKFVSDDEGLYPTAETLFAFGVYTSSPLANKRTN